jgi:hypothetical protein
MGTERRLRRDEAGSAAQVQAAIDALGDEGGRLILPELELELDRALRLRSGVALQGQGEKTVLRKGAGRVYPLSGYHNYGMRDVPLASAAGLEPGMTVSVHDDRTHGGFYETFATIAWVDGDWVGLDRGIEADYAAAANPCLTTVFPLVCGHHLEGAALRHVRLEGNREQSPKAMGGCRGGAVYFGNCRDIEIAGVSEQGYYGEGLSFQMCRDVRIHDCRFDGNSGNGLHPGAGSTNVLFDSCVGQGNGRSGFFFCVRANHITVRRCRFAENETGISIGTRDCNNLIQQCSVEGNAGPGILFRETPPPTEVHSCLVQDCRIQGNAHASGKGQVEVLAAAHDLVLERSQIEGGPRPGVAGLWAAPGTGGLYLEGNRFSGCAPEVDAPPGSLVAQRPRFSCGSGVATEREFRHLR